MSFLQQNSVLPSLRVNFLSNQPLSISLNDRGTIVLPLKVQGSKGEIFKISLEKNELKDKSKTLEAKEQLLLDLALDYANQVIIYSLGEDEPTGDTEGSTYHTTSDIDDMLAALEIIDFNTICYPYDVQGVEEKIIAWVKKQRENENPIQAVISISTAPDHEGIINVGNGLVLSNGEVLTAKESTVVVASMTAGARVNQSLTNKKVLRAVDISPRMTKEEKENAVKAGKFIFSVNRNQVVTVVIDINSLTSFEGKADFFRKNRTVRVMDNIVNDLTTIFDSNIKGIENNNDIGRSKFKGMLVEYFRNLETINAIQNFNPDDVIVKEVVNQKDSIEVALNIQTVDSIEKVYVNVMLS